jgi:hypothetical protein
MSENLTSLRRLLWLAFILAVAVALIVIYAVIHRPAPDVVVDFSNRTAGAPITRDLLGSGGVGSTLSNNAGMKLITDSNIRGNRIWAALDLIYKTSTPDYGLFDQQLARATANGLDPIIELSGAPAGMGSSWCDVPTGANIALWADDAAAVAAHIEQLSPGKRLEIWNEPDSSVSSCVSKDMLTDYMNLFAAAAPKVKQAAPTSKVGGPALAAPGPNTSTWIPALLSDPRTAPYMEFVSYHVYITGQWDLDNGMNWQSSYNLTVDPNRGYQYLYRQLEALVRKGKQPNAAHTPIYLTEYNLNWVFKPNCCQNEPSYGPLWNAVLISEMLNAVNDGASTVVDGLVYFMAASANNYFCLVGAPSSDYTNCQWPAGSDGPTGDKTYAVYPSLLTFQMFAQNDALGIEDGGYVVHRPTAPESLRTVALYTQSGDSVVLINPTSTDYPELKVQLKNVGLQHLQGESFVIVNNQLIRSTPMLRPRKDGIETTVALPPYSTVAVKLSEGN